MTTPYAFIGWARDWLPPMNVDGGYMCVVDRWYDGDTVFVWVWLRGFDISIYTAVRISNVWAPELNEPGGPEAREYMSGLFPRDTKLRLEINGRSFSRVVGKFTARSGEDVGSLALRARIGHELIKERKVGLGAKYADRVAFPGPYE